jgi:hypothetical protein
MAAAPPRSYEIEGQRVEMPVVVRDAASGAATYLVSAARARSLLPGDDFEVAELLPGRTVLSLAMIDYRDNDLGDYDEVSVTFFVRPRGERPGLPVPYVGTALDFLRQRLGTFIYRLPVNQRFTCEAGRRIWGFPKTVEEIEIRHAEDRSTCRLAMDGRHVLTLSLPRGGTGRMPEREMTTYTYIDGAPHRTRSTMGGEGFRAGGGGGARLELGDHPLADALRGLGLPRRALLCMWTEHMHARFEAAEKL